MLDQEEAKGDGQSRPAAEGEVAQHVPTRPAKARAFRAARQYAEEMEGEEAENGGELADVDGGHRGGEEIRDAETPGGEEVECQESVAESDASVGAHLRPT